MRCLLALVFQFAFLPGGAEDTSGADSLPALSLQDAVSSVRQVAASPELSAAQRIASIDQIRLQFADRLSGYYRDSFRALSAPLRGRGDAAIEPNQLSKWYQAHRVKLQPKRNGIAAVSAIINDRHRIIMCTVPKIDSSSWRKVMLYLEHPEFYGSVGRHPPDQHNIKKNGVKIMAQQTPDEANMYYNNEKYIKLFHCRNPVVRVLSAWMSKNARSANPIPFAADYATFEAFLVHLRNDGVNLSSADAHIRHQHAYCDADRGAHYDLLLKMENRRCWNRRLLSFMKLENDSFVAPLFLKQARPRADRLQELLTHYTPRLLGIAKALYAEDIQLFGYGEDVALLEEILILRDDILRDGPRH